MAKRTFLYSDRKAKTVSVEMEECVKSPFTVVRTVTRYDDGSDSMLKPQKGKSFDPKDPNTRIFVIMDVQNQPELLIREIGVLNNEGFDKVINVNGNSFELLDGAVVTCVGKTLTFEIV